MSYKTDLEIAQEAKLSHINNIAKKLNIDEDELELYGKYKAKLPLSLIDDNKVSSRYVRERDLKGHLSATVETEDEIKFRKEENDKKRKDRLKKKKQSQKNST